MLEVLNLDPTYEKQTFDMIRKQIRIIPPFFAPSDDDIRSIMNEPILHAIYGTEVSSMFTRYLLGLHMGLLLHALKLRFRRIALQEMLLGLGGKEFPIAGPIYFKTFLTTDSSFMINTNGKVTGVTEKWPKKSFL